jgi:dihydrofolate reductase
MNFTLIVAVDKQNGIGLNNSIPFHIKGDLLFFKETTTKTNDDTKINAVVMGYNTYCSIPNKKLHNRLNVVLTKDKTKLFPNDIIVKYSLEEALSYLKSLKQISASNDPPLKIIESVFVIGGSKLYDLAVKSSYCEKILLTNIYANYNCDTFFTKNYDNDYYLYDKSDIKNNNIDNVKYQFFEYRRY